MKKMVEPAGFNWIDTPTLPKKQIYDTITTKLAPQVFTKEDAYKFFHEVKTLVTQK